MGLGCVVLSVCVCGAVVGPMHGAVVGLIMYVVVSLHVLHGAVVRPMVQY